MNDSFRSTPPGQPWSGPNPAGNGYQPSQSQEAPKGAAGDDGAEVGKALLVGLLGGLVSAAGYMIYRRLPDEQKERLNAQVRTVVQQRISEIRQNFNI
jgi:hypothetical protein